MFLIGIWWRTVTRIQGLQRFQHVSWYIAETLRLNFIFSTQLNSKNLVFEMVYYFRKLSIVTPIWMRSPYVSAFIILQNIEIFYFFDFDWVMTASLKANLPLFVNHWRVNTYFSLSWGAWAFYVGERTTDMKRARMNNECRVMYCARDTIVNTIIRSKLKSRPLRGSHAFVISH